MPHLSRSQGALPICMHSRYAKENSLFYVSYAYGPLNSRTNQYFLEHGYALFAADRCETKGS